MAIDGLSSVTVPASAQGLVCVAVGTVTAGSALSIDNCFTSAYENYRIVLTSNVATTFRFRVSGADNSTSAYYEQFINGNNTTISGARSAVQTLNNLNSSAGVVALDVFGPATAAAHYMLGTITQGGTTLTATNYAYHFSSATAFDGFSILGTSMTATVRVFGYRNNV